MAKSKKQIELEQQIGELTQDLQRTRADFENYRKRVELEKQQAKESGRAQSILKLLPVIDTIERAITHIPDDIASNPWVSGVAALQKSIAKLLSDYRLERIDITQGETEFDPEYHEAISTDDSEGDREVVTEELQPGYVMEGIVVRHAMVRVGRK